MVNVFRLWETRMSQTTTLVRQYLDNFHNKWAQNAVMKTGHEILCDLKSYQKKNVHALNRKYAHNFKISIVLILIIISRLLN